VRHALRLLRGTLAVLAVAVSVAVQPSAAFAAARAPGSLAAAVGSAASRYGVPARLLLAMSWVNARDRMPRRQSPDGGWGVMHIIERRGGNQVAAAAGLTGLTASVIRHHERANVLAAAALLRSIAGTPATLEGWYDAVARFGGGRLYADAVFAAAGRRGTGHSDMQRLAAVPAAASLPPAAGHYTGAAWIPASSANRQAAQRPVSSPITQIVIHATQSSFASALNWFRNPRAYSSANYLIRSSDGAIAQLVSEGDIAWHAGNRAVNAASIGIEHEGFVGDCSWFTDAMYRSSARLVAALTLKYGIPIDRRHIIGHNQVPDPFHPGLFGGANHHSDPGRCWNWPKYMALVRADVAGSAAAPTARVVDNRTPHSFVAPGWTIAHAAANRYGPDYAISSPTTDPAAAAASFTVSAATTGTYALYARWPSVPAANRAVPVTIDTATGLAQVTADQHSAPGRWNDLGSFPLTAGIHTVRFLRQTAAAGPISADAVQLERAEPLIAAHLIEDQVGWALTANQLSMTNDGGRSWRNITPAGVAPTSIRGLTFRDRSDGALVSLDPRHALALWQTSTGGRSWAMNPIATPSDLDVAATISIATPDPEHWFIALPLAGPTLSRRAQLIASSDHGATWTTRTLPVAGVLTFDTASDGWLSTDSATGGLYRTLTAGASWQPVQLPPPARFRYAGIAPGPPRISATTTIIPATLIQGNRAAAAFYTTLDGGQSWSLVKTATAALPPLGLATPTAVTTDGSTIVAQPEGTFAASAGSDPLKLPPVPISPASMVAALDFTSPSYGWATLRTCATAGTSCQLTWTQLDRAVWRPLLPP
jgi:N-acetyl-anhydromuramyl-L-alanine amidase AmpD/photosystem II stability/assembly factor-like uncharacterized protein